MYKRLITLLLAVLPLAVLAQEPYAVFTVTDSENGTLTFYSDNNKASH